MNFIKILFGIICITILLNGCIEIPFETSQGEGNYSDHIATANIDGTGRFDIMERGYALFVTDPNDITQEKLLLIQDKLYLMDLDGTNKTLLLDIDIEKNLGFNNSRNKLLYMVNDDLILYDFRSGNQIHIAEDIDISLVDANFDNTDCQVIYAINKSGVYSAINSYDINIGVTEELYKIELASVNADHVNINDVYQLNNAVFFKKTIRIDNSDGSITVVVEINKLNLISREIDVLDQGNRIIQFKLDYTTENIVLKKDNLFLTNISNISEQAVIPHDDTRYFTGAGVSIFDEFVYTARGIYNIDTEEFIETSLWINDINKNKTKIIGIADSPAEEE